VSYRSKPTVMAFQHLNSWGKTVKLSSYWGLIHYRRVNVRKLLILPFKLLNLDNVTLSGRLVI
jgi:hypothetical protein